MAKTIFDIAGVIANAKCGLVPLELRENLVDYFAHIGIALCGGAFVTDGTRVTGQYMYID